MTWGRWDDKTATDPRWVGIADVALRSVAKEYPTAKQSELREFARLATKNARHVHSMAVLWTVPALTDGKITLPGAEQICAIGALTLDEFEEAAELLVASGAWKRNRPTKSEPFGSWQMLLSWAPGEQPLRVDEELRKARNTLRGRLREGREDYPNKLAAIARADGHCEYCDAEIGPDGGEIDHVDPTILSNDVDNLAHVCSRCNKRKGNHTLEAVRMDFTTRAKLARGIPLNPGEQP